MESIEEACLRWPSILWKQSRPDGGRLALQMRQNPRDHRRVFNAAVRRLDDDLDGPGAAFADLGVDPDAAQLNTRFSRCIQVIDAWRSAGVLSSQFSPVG
jgi:hypothetical protein